MGRAASRWEIVASPARWCSQNKPKVSNCCCKVNYILGCVSVRAAVELVRAFPSQTLPAVHPHPTRRQPTSERSRQGYAPLRLPALLGSLALCQKGRLLLEDLLRILHPTLRSQPFSANRSAGHVLGGLSRKTGEGIFAKKTTQQSEGDRQISGVSVLPQLGNNG